MASNSYSACVAFEADWLVLVGDTKSSTRFSDWLLVSQWAPIHGNIVESTSLNPIFLTPRMPFEIPLPLMHLSNIAAGGSRRTMKPTLFLGN